jgi:hypothetical protein
MMQAVPRGPAATRSAQLFCCFFDGHGEMLDTVEGESLSNVEKVGFPKIRRRTWDFNSMIPPRSGR